MSKKGGRRGEHLMVFRASDEMKEAVEAYGRSLGIVNANGKVNVSSTVGLIVMEYLRDLTGFSQLQNAMFVARSESINMLRLRLQALYSLMLEEMK